MSLNSISYQFIQIAKMHRDHIRSGLQDLDLYLGQDLLLFQLWKQDGLTNGELAHSMMVEPAAISKTVKRMENAGWIVRRQDDDDARVIRIHLTDKSREVQPKVESLWNEVEQKLVEDLSLEEKLLLRRLLVDVRKNFDSEEGKS